MDEEEEQEIATSISIFRYGTGREYAASTRKSSRDRRTSARQKDSPVRCEDETSDLIDNIIASHERLRADLFSQTALFTEMLSEQLATQTAVLSAMLAEKVAQQTAQLNATMDHHLSQLNQCNGPMSSVHRDPYKAGARQTCTNRPNIESSVLVNNTSLHCSYPLRRVAFHYISWFSASRIG